MAKTRTQYLCRECGGVQSQWLGKCPDCGTWDALEPYREARAPKAAGVVEVWLEEDGHGGSPRATPLPEIEPGRVTRILTGIGELDRVLGGGLVPGSVVLLGGDPGIGKSTLLLQACGRLAQRGERVLYVTSEESAYQTRLRAERLFGGDGASDPAAALAELLVLADTNLARITEQARRSAPRVMVVDSIQMVYKGDLEASPGSIAQLRRCCMELVYLAKTANIAVVLIGHVTKDGQLAGPKLLEHLVDAVLSFEGDRHHAHRIVRGLKNRYGTTLEVGLFEMTGAGLAEIADPGALLDPARSPRAGSVMCPVIHGTRCLLVEVQALTATGFLGSAKRKTSGIDVNRLAMLVAVLEKHGGLRLADRDVFVSAVGGLKVMEPAADLAICLAIAGAHLDRCLPADVVAVGEIGLGGELRCPPQMTQRAGEASRLGYRAVLAAGGGNKSVVGMDLRPVSGVSDAIEHLTPQQRV